MDPTLKRGFRIGAYEVDPLSGRVKGPAGEQHVQPKVMDVLVCLAARSGEIVERDTIVEQVWRRASSEEVLTRCISELRRVFDDDRGVPRYIQTIPKRGYRLLEPVVAVGGPATAPGGAARGETVTVLLVDDHALFREGIKLQLHELDDKIVCIEAGSCEEALQFAAHEVDLILLDFGLPGLQGLEAIARLKQAFSAPITIVSATDDSATIRGAIKNGAVGFIPKTMSKKEFFAALGVVRAGAVYLPPQVLFRSGAHGVELSELQQRVLSAAVRGKPLAGIAADLELTEEEVETQLNRAYRVLAVDNRIDALYELAKRGMPLR